MKISVCMLSYNHAEYIVQAIEGIVSQKTDFDVEIVIGDDCSIDGTIEILKKYHSLYPNKINLLLHDNNVGMMNNFISTLKACTGEYVAICEGDDYWVSDVKLQTQVDFLDNNLNYSICFHRVYEQIGENKKISPDNPWSDEKTFNILDLTNGNFMHTNSVVYRNNLFYEFPEWYDKSPIGDYVLHLMNARYGLVKYFPQVMGVYRKFSGTWSSQTKAIQIKRVVQALDYLAQENFEPEVNKSLHSYKMNLLSEYCRISLYNNDFSYLEDMKLFIKNESEFIQNWMLTYYPDKINQILNSRTYKVANYLRNLKNKISL